MKELMVDLETMSTDSKGAIVSIGAVFFDFESGKIGPKFYEKIELQSCIDAGLVVDASTIYWWLEQEDAARNALLSGKLPLDTVLSNFTKWFKTNNPKANVWGNGATFDNVLLTSAYAAVGIGRPWAYWADRDVRTLVALSGIKTPRNVAGVAHTPVDDCMHQINYCIKAWEKLHG